MLLIFCTSSCAAQFIYNPPEPTEPNSPSHILGTVSLDTTPLAVNCMAVDRSVVHSMYPENSRCYILNVDYIWFLEWTKSKYGSFLSYTYPKEGEYTVKLEIWITWQGGTVTKIKTEKEIQVYTRPMSDVSINSNIPDSNIHVSFLSQSLDYYFDIRNTTSGETLVKLSQDINNSTKTYHVLLNDIVSAASVKSTIDIESLVSGKNIVSYSWSNNSLSESWNLIFKK